MKEVKKNFIYNLLYQVFVLVFPIILIPYTSRVLGVEAIGIYSYTYSIVSYFIMFALLGINNFGSRKIAKCRKDKIELSKVFFSIYAIQIFMTILMIIFYCFYIVFFIKENIIISIIQGIFLFSTLLDINWFFAGIEKFKINILRNIFLKIITFILIILFVKCEKDLWKYTLILSASSLICNLYWIKYLRKEINIVNITLNDIKPNIKPCLILFLPVIAKSIYQSMDKLMLGSMINMTEVGLYEQAAKLVKIPLCLVDALATVMIPRNSKLVSLNKNDSIKNNIEKSIYFIMFLILPICLGLIAVSDKLIIIILGNDFAGSANILKILAISTIFVSFANVIKSQYLMPNEKDDKYVGATVIGAITNLILNLLLIPKFYAIGAALGTLITEIFVMLYQVLNARKDLPILKYLKSIISIILKSLIMFIIVYIFNFIKLDSIITIFLQILIGVIIYGLLNFKYIINLIGIKKEN